MKKVLMLLFFVLANSFIFAQDKSIDDLIIYLSKEHNVSNKSEMYYQMVLASDGCRIEINTISVEIYKYDMNNPEYKTYIESAKSIFIALAESFEMKCYLYVNKSFLLVMKMDNNETKKIIETFNRF